MKRLLFFFFFLGSLQYGFSQTQFGINGGAGLATISGDDASNDLANKFGFQLGGLARIPVSDQFLIQPELNFASKGTGFDDNDAAPRNLLYITAPILATFLVSENVNVHVGPEIGFLMGVSDDDLTRDQEDAVKDNTSDIDIGVSLGGDYFLDSGLGIGLDYNLGLTKLDDDGEADLFNRFGKIKISYLFN